MYLFAMPPETIPMLEIVDQYDSFFALGLTEQEKIDLIAYLLGPIAPRSDHVYEPQASDPINSWGLS